MIRCWELRRTYTFLPFSSIQLGKVVFRIRTHIHTMLMLFLKHLLDGSCACFAQFWLLFPESWVHAMPPDTCIIANARTHNKMLCDYGLHYVLFKMNTNLRKGNAPEINFILFFAFRECSCFFLLLSSILCLLKSKSKNEMKREKTTNRNSIIIITLSVSQYRGH